MPGRAPAPPKVTDNSNLMKGKAIAVHTKQLVSLDLTTAPPPPEKKAKLAVQEHQFDLEVFNQENKPLGRLVIVTSSSSTPFTPFIQKLTELSSNSRIRNHIQYLVFSILFDRETIRISQVHKLHS